MRKTDENTDRCEHPRSNTCIFLFYGEQKVRSKFVRKIYGAKYGRSVNTLGQTMRFDRKNTDEKYGRNTDEKTDRNTDRCEHPLMV